MTKVRYLYGNGIMAYMASEQPLPRPSSGRDFKAKPGQARATPGTDAACSPASAEWKSVVVRWAIGELPLVEKPYLRYSPESFTALQTLIPFPVVLVGPDGPDGPDGPWDHPSTHEA